MRSIEMLFVVDVQSVDIKNDIAIVRDDLSATPPLPLTMTLLEKIIRGLA